MLRLVAEYADSWNGELACERNHLDRIPPLRDAVDAAYRMQGRGPATLARTVAINVATAGGTFPNQAPGEIAEALRGFARAEIDEIHVWLTPNSLASNAAFAPVLGRLDRG